MEIKQKSLIEEIGQYQHYADFYLSKINRLINMETIKKWEHLMQFRDLTKEEEKEYQTLFTNYDTAE
jgi:hypothetical protein